MIDIVTAFFDIGRGSWEGNGLPNYLKRTKSEYLKNFSRLCKLENKIVVYTSKDLVDEIKKIRNNNIEVVPIDNFRELYPEIYSEISEVMKNPKFQTILNQPYNPEYWNADYVMVNLLKSHFVEDAINNNLVSSDLVSWIDFGYCRTDETIEIEKWNYNFEKNKIHFFNIKQIPNRIDVIDLIVNNEVYIMGCHIVSAISLWPKLKESMFKNMNLLLENELVDDDQSLLLMSYVENQNISKCHYVDPSDWFVVFKKFNSFVEIK